MQHFFHNPDITCHVTLRETGARACNCCILGAMLVSTGFSASPSCILRELALFLLSWLEKTAAIRNR